ncbi:MAG: hypothetical protein HQL07_09845 [Nitrospirae bacterium]|nr:hypothetical protein [Magnetococcales bacterium]HAT48920.1 hypothetical protein [Alphaproteobacteria bacterium]
MGTELENMNKMMALIRDNQFGEAWEFLESLLITDPGQVAQWYLFSRFMAQGGERFGEVIRGALGEVGRAATRGFEGVLKGLESYDPDEGIREKEGSIERLETFWRAMGQGGQGGLGPRPVVGRKDGQDADLEPLLRFLEWAMRGRVMRLDPARGGERRLDGLRRRMQEGSSAAVSVSWGGHRLAERLIGFGDSLGGKGKNDVRRL